MSNVEESMLSKLIFNRAEIKIRADGLSIGGGSLDLNNCSCFDVEVDLYDSREPNLFPSTTFRERHAVDIASILLRRVLKK